MASRLRSGFSAWMSSIVSPPSIRPRIEYTVMRVPRMTGAPPSMSVSTTIQASQRARSASAWACRSERIDRVALGGRAHVRLQGRAIGHVDLPGEQFADEALDGHVLED